MNGTACPLCSAADPEPVFALRGMPVLCNELWPDADTARNAPRGDVELVFCGTCGLIWNRAFVPSRLLYSSRYENPLHFSPHFRAFAEALARDLVARNGLVGRHVVEIGCGDGYMLDQMVLHGAATATGFDPSMQGRQTPFATRNGVRIVPEHFRPGHLRTRFDALIARHVLEHLEAPVAFVRALRVAAAGRRVVHYFEVPSAEGMLEQVSVWDVIYEHATYWTEPALETLLRRCGLVPTRLGSCYGGQFLMAEAVPDEPEPDFFPDGADVVARRVGSFASAAEALIERWCARLETFGGTAAIWGAGSKGITLANIAGRSSSSLAALIDVNPCKQGLYIPGAALPVKAPDVLPVLRPDLVVVSNPAYRREIRDRLQELGLTPELETLAGSTGQAST